MWMCTLDGQKFKTEDEARDDFYAYSNDEIFEEMEKSLSYRDLVEMVLDLNDSFYASDYRRTVDRFIDNVVNKFVKASDVVFAEQYEEIEDEADEAEKNDEDEMC